MVGVGLGVAGSRSVLEAVASTVALEGSIVALVESDSAPDSTVVSAGSIALVRLTIALLTTVRLTAVRSTAAGFVAVVATRSTLVD